MSTSRERDLAPPVALRGWAWARENLFNSRLNTVLTVLMGAVLAWGAWRAVRFVFVSAEWEIVRRNLRVFMVGRFPPDELWRPWAATYVLALAAGVASGVLANRADRGLAADGRTLAGARRAGLARVAPPVVLVVAMLSLTRTIGPTLLVVGAVAVLLVARWLTRASGTAGSRTAWSVVAAGAVAAVVVLVAFGGVGWNRWGGVHLTLFATVTGIGAAFPLGLLLALGRRSSFPVVRGASIAYIELFRGVPLITLLFMGQFMLGFFLPPGFSTPALVTRAMVAIIFFEAAYVAEIVRGGLQSVPRGQVEAAQALGLSPVSVTRLVVLPQALRAVIPAMVGQFISLYKDTSLLAALGLFELLDVARSVTQQPDFLAQGLASVTLPFAGFIYWVVSYTMSSESRRLERRLGVGER